MSGTYPQVNLSEQTFKEAMSRFPSGVTVIMTEGEEGHSVGMTASAFISVSLSPPLVLDGGESLHRVPGSLEGRVLVTSVDRQVGEEQE